MGKQIQREQQSKGGSSTNSLGVVKKWLSWGGNGEKVEDFALSAS